MPALKPSARAEVTPYFRAFSLHCPLRGFQSWAKPAVKPGIWLQSICWGCSIMDLWGALPVLSPKRLLLISRASSQNRCLPTVWPLGLEWPQTAELFPCAIPWEISVGNWGWQSDQMPSHSPLAAAEVALVCVVMFPSLQGRRYFGGMPPEWGKLNGADPQKNARAECMMLAD